MKPIMLLIGHLSLTASVIENNKTIKVKKEEGEGEIGEGGPAESYELISLKILCVYGSVTRLSVRRLY